MNLFEFLLVRFCFCLRNGSLTLVPCASSPTTRVSRSPLSAGKARNLRKRQLWFSCVSMIQCLFNLAWCSLRSRRNYTSVSNVCEAALRSLFWAPNGLKELPEERFDFLSSRLANRQWHFKQANNGAYSNLGTQVRAKTKDFGAVSQTDCVCSAKCGRQIPGLQKTEWLYSKHHAMVLGPVVPRPISANPRLSFNPGFYFFCSKAFFRILDSF